MIPLHFDCKNKHENIINYLIKYGVDVNKAENFGCTTLHFVCDQENGNSEKYLIQHGANVKNHGNIYDKTLLQFTCDKDIKILQNTQLNMEEKIYIYKK